MKESNIIYLEKHVSKEKLGEAKERLANGEPVQYIVGNVDFYGNTIKVDKRVLIPRFETERLVELTIKRIKQYFNRDINILDIGTGSGCIAITLKKELNANVDAIDISKDAIDLAKENAKLNDVDVNFIVSNMETYKEKTYDVIISNPPYIAYDEEIMDIVKENEPNIALYAKDNGLYYYKKIIDNIPYITKDRYLISFEIGNKQANDITKYAKSKLKDINVMVEKDYSGFDRYIFITNIKD